MKSVPVKPNILGQMFPLQYDLLHAYDKVYGFPKWPGDLNDRAMQEWIKGHIGNFLEELAEAYTSLSAVLAATEANEVATAQAELRSYNIEMADAWHFLLEILVYLGVDDVRLDQMIHAWLPSKDDRLAGFFQPGNPFKTLLIAAGLYNQEHGYRTLLNKADRFTVATEAEMADDFRLCGGRRISNGLMWDHAMLLWNITHVAGMLRNSLKLKQWSQAERKVNEVKINELTCELVYGMALYMDFAGFGEIQIFNLYRMKNMENHDRIKNKY